MDSRRYSGNICFIAFEDNFDKDHALQAIGCPRCGSTDIGTKTYLQTIPGSDCSLVCSAATYKKQPMPP